MQESLVTVHIEAVSQPVSADTADTDLQAANYAETECPAAAVAPASSASFDPYNWLTASGLLAPSQEEAAAEEIVETAQSAERAMLAAATAPLAATIISPDEPYAPGSRWMCDLCNVPHTCSNNLMVQSYAWHTVELCMHGNKDCSRCEIDHQRP
jgi:hypothetical protein